MQFKGTDVAGHGLTVVSCISLKIALATKISDFVASRLLKYLDICNKMIGLAPKLIAQPPGNKI